LKKQQTLLFERLQVLNLGFHYNLREWLNIWFNLSLPELKSCREHLPTPSGKRSGWARRQLEDMLEDKVSWLRNIINYFQKASQTNSMLSNFNTKQCCQIWLLVANLATFHTKFWQKYCFGYFYFLLLFWLLFRIWYILLLFENIHLKFIFLTFYGIKYYW